MNEERINIAELLKDCPKGTKLYSPICGEAKFRWLDKDGRDDDIIVVEVSEKSQTGFVDEVSATYTISFDVYGRRDKYNGECLLFPSKEVRDWRYFCTFYVRTHDNMSLGERSDAMKLLREKGGAKSCETDPYLENGEDIIWYTDRVTNTIKSTNIHCMPYGDYILSTGTELKLIEEPKFKVGDVVVTGVGITNDRRIIVDYKDGLYYISNPIMHGCEESVLHATRLATPEEIAEWNEKMLQPKHLHYSTSKRKIIDWFKEFDRVLVRCDKKEPWRPRLFDYYRKRLGGFTYRYKCQDGSFYRYCIPYNERTAKLIGTTDDYEEE